MTFAHAWRVALAAMVLSLPAHAAPDEELLGKSRGYPIGTRSNWFYDETVRVGSFSHMDSILPHRVIAKSDTPRPLPRAAKEQDYTYTFDHATRTIEDFLARRRITGLMVVQDGVVQFERYQYDRTPRHRLLSNSMAKSITAIAVGLALAEGKIRSLDDTAATYVPELAGSGYGETPIRALLRMASGIAFSERYDGKDDIQKFAMLSVRDGTLAAIRAFDRREHAPNTRFQYASIETVVLSYVLKGATGQSLSGYVAERLWRPMGAEADASWIIDRAGVELAHGFFNATLRDWARLGMLLADDGMIDGRQIIPRDFLIEATDAGRQPMAFRPRRATAYYGYGYKFWLYPSTPRRFSLLGVYGQSIFVDPGTRLALIITAAQKEAVSAGPGGFGAERDALWRGILGRHGAKW
ncbi:MAG: serine hydrolase [Alphaproteobacteria bacterium]|nr:serine hydrolase [Alphaproteobacteria bacterium]MCW5738640.1 serine hydrolase [Alphaproteobacteria bacterium]